MCLDSNYQAISISAFLRMVIVLGDILCHGWLGDKDQRLVTVKYRWVAEKCYLTRLVHVCEIMWSKLKDFFEVALYKCYIIVRWNELFMCDFKV